MKKSLKGNPILIISVCAAFLLPSFLGYSTASGKDTETFSINHGKPDDKLTYMGMFSANCTFYIPMPLVTPNLQTSHGVFFPKIQLYTGLSTEYYFLFNYLAVNPHIRYYYSSSKKVSGYVGAEVGCLMNFREGKTYAGLDIAPEIGFTVNFSKISLDFGVKAVLFPTEGLDGFYPVRLPLRIGIIF